MPIDTGARRKGRALPRIGPTHTNVRVPNRAPGAQRLQRSLPPSNVLVGPESATSRNAERAARKFVDQHVSINRQGIPALLPSAIQGITQAVHDIHPTVTEPSAARSVAKVSGPKAERRISKALAGIPDLSETAKKPAVRQAMQQTSRQILRSEWERTPDELKPLFKKQVDLAKAHFKLNRAEKQGVNTAKQQRLVQIRKSQVTREVNRQAELGNIEHPKMPHSLTSVIGDLIPDQPVEIAADVALGAAGSAVVRGGASAVKGAAEAASEAGARGVGRTLPAIRGGAEVLGATRPGKVFKAARRISRSPAGRATKLGAAGVAVGSGRGIPFVEGQVKGAVEHPIGTAKTTARSLASIPAFAIGGAGALGVTTRRLVDPSHYARQQGLGYALTPVTRFASENYKQAKRMLETLGSGDVNRIAEATAKDYGVAPLIGTAGLLRGAALPALRHGVARARGIEVPKGGAAPHILPRFEDTTGYRMKVLAGRAQTITNWRIAKNSHRAMRELRRLNTKYNPDAKVALGGRTRAFRRSRIGRKLDEFSKETGKKVGPQDLAMMAAENPLRHYRSKAEATREARAGLKRTAEGTPEHRYYQAVLKVPELYDESQFHRTVGALRDSLETVTRSEDVRYFPVYEEHAKRTGEPTPPRPEDAVPHEARPYTDARTREAAVGRGTVETYRRSEIYRERQELKKELAKDNPDPIKVTRLRERIRVKREAMGPVKLTDRERAQVLADYPYGKGPVQTAALKVAQQEKRVARDEAQMPALRQEFRQGAENILTAAGREGQRPVYFPHTDEERLSIAPPAPGHPRAGTTVDRERILGPGSIESQGKVDYGAHRYLNALTGAARADAQARFGGWLRDTITKVHDIGAGPQRAFSKKQLARMEQSGAYDPEKTYRVSTAFFDNPDRVPPAEVEALASKAGGDTEYKLQQTAQKLEREGEGDSYYLVDRKDMDKYLKTQQVMGGFESKLAKLGTFESRAVLATSFAWMTAQVVAEGFQLLATQSPYRLARSLNDTIRLRHTKWAQNLAYISDGAIGTDMPHGRMGAKSYQEAISKGFDTAHRLPINEFMRKLATFQYPGQWDRFKGGFLRDWYVVAEMDKQFNSRMRNFARGMGESWTAIDEISHELRGKSPEEQFASLNTPKGRAAEEELMHSVDRMLGNWTALSPAERLASHVLFFYPFMRFSVDFILRTFPADRPIRYTLATSMGSWNAEQLEHWLTKKPSFFTEWLQSPIYGEPKGHPTSFISFSRVTPGSNALIEAIGSQKSLAGVTLSVMRPFEASVLQGIFKYNRFGEFDENQTLPQALRDTVLGLTAPGRTIRQALQPSDQPGAEGRLRYGIRSNVFPFLPQDYRSAKVQATVNELWEQVQDGGKISQTGGTRYTELNRKYQSWREEDEKYVGPLNDAKDIPRYTKTTGPKNKADYTEYLKLYLRRREGRKQSDLAHRRLVTLYGREGAPLTSSLKSFYGQHMDTGQPGPRAQSGINKYGPQGGVLGKAQRQMKLGQPISPKVAQQLTGTPLAPRLRKKVEEALGTPRTTGGPYAGAFPGIAKRPLGGEGARPTLTKTAQGKPKPAPKPTPTTTPVQISQQLRDAGIDSSDKVVALRRASKQSGVPVEVLASIGKIETSNGTSSLPGVKSGTNSAGAAGPFQFIESSWNTVAQQLWGKNANKHSVYNYNDAAQATGQYLKNADWKTGNQQAMHDAIYSYNHADWYVNDVLQGANQLSGQIKGGVIKVKHPNARPFDIHATGANAAKIVNPKWDVDSDGHSLTRLAKGISPVVKRWAKKYDITVGAGYDPESGEHVSPGHNVTGTATDVYPRENTAAGWDRLEQGIAVLAKMGFEVGYDGSVPGTQNWSNHGRGNHAHIEWVGQGSSTKAIKKLSGLTNAQIAKIESGAGGGGAFGNGGASFGGGASGGSAGSGSSPGGGGGSSSYKPLSFTGTGSSSSSSTLPSAAESIATLGMPRASLLKLPAVPTVTKRRRSTRPLITIPVSPKRSSR